VPSLTDAERRGALWLALLLLLGVLHDLYRAHRPTWAPEPPAPSGVAVGPNAADSSSPSPPGASPAPPREPGPVDLNRAGERELDRLPGIGPVLARRIVAHRERHGPFHSPDELLAVPGIGPRLLERIRPHVRTPG